MIIVIVTGGFCVVTVEDIIWLVCEPTATSITLIRQRELSFPAVTICSLNLLNTTTLESTGATVVNDLNRLSGADPPECKVILNKVVDNTGINLSWGEITNLASNNLSVLPIGHQNTIIETVAAVIVLNIAHSKVCLHVRGQHVLALKRRTHLIVAAVALIYVIGITVSFPLCLLETYNNIDIDWNKSEIFLAIWFPLLNQCNLFILYVASIRTTNHPLFYLQRKKAQATDHTDKKHLTNPSSHPLNQPSHTTFPICYTGGFTDITETSGVYCDDTCTSSNGEVTPLLRAGRHESSKYSRSAELKQILYSYLYSGGVY